MLETAMHAVRDVTVNANSHRHAFADLHGTLSTLGTVLFFNVEDVQLIAEPRQTGRPAL